MSASNHFDYTVPTLHSTPQSPPDGYVHAEEPAADGVHGAEAAVGPSPLRSAASFEWYCDRIQSRLAEHAAARIHFLQSAHDRLSQLLHAAREVEDSALADELSHHRAAARELLDALKRSGHGQSSAVVSSPIGAPPVPSAPGPAKPVPIDTVAGRHTPLPPQKDPPVFAAVSGAPVVGAVPEPAPSATRVLRRPVRPLEDIEADAIRIRAEIKDWNSKRPLASKHGELNLPNCLLLRAEACRHQRLAEEAGDTEVAEVTELRSDIVGLMDAANDQDYTIALDDSLDPRPTAYQWGELADRYEEMARAQEAFEWWQRNRNALSSADIQPLAEAIAAVQQRFNRILFRVGARDPFQQALFDELRTWAREAQCYLQSLRPKVPTGELIERASTLDFAMDQAREVVLEEERRVQAVDRVIALLSDPDFGSDTEHDEERLREAVWDCRQHRIPASDRRMRDALLPWGSFLEGDERFREVLREINLEWERRQDQGRPEEEMEEPDNSLDAVWAELELVRQVTRGKRCLMLGGTCREENRRKIEDALELTELIWPSTKPSDPLSKYDTDIRHSDVVALLTRFSRKEWKSAQDICARDGKRFVHLTSGYGVSQVIRHFFRQLCPEAAVRGG